MRDDSGYLTAFALIREMGVTHDQNEGAATGVVEAVMSGDNKKTLLLISALVGIIIDMMQTAGWSADDILRVVETAEFDILAGVEQ